MLKKVRLEMARSAEFPEGNANRGYEFRAPLSADGDLDTEEWPSVRRQCTVRRFWDGEEDEVGELHHTRHRTWAFSYEPGDEDDTPFFHLETHALKEGEYVSIREADGKSSTFRVVSVR